MTFRTGLTGLLLACAVLPDVAARDLERRDYAMAEQVYRAGNYRDAYLKLLPLAQEGNASAQFLLGRISDNGLGPVRLDPDEAFRWYLKAARNGSGAGQFAVAKAYAIGRGVMASQQQSLEWLKKAADADYVPAILSLASIYRDGRGVDKNTALAAKLEHHAADLGNPEAEYRIAERYQSGHSVAEDQKLATEWLTRAAASGHPGALYRMAQIAAADPEASADERIQSFVFMTLASQRGADDVKRNAQQELVAIRASLSPTELAAAQALLKAWKPTVQPIGFAAPGDEDHVTPPGATAPAKAAKPR
jgi:TPR repeat protein